MFDNDETVPASRPVPYYGSYASFLRALKALKDHGIPKHVTPRSMIPLLGDEATRIGTGFGSMGWADENGAPSEDLKALVKAFGESSWRSTLTSVVRKAYSFVPDALADLTPTQLHEAFVAYTGRDAQVMQSAETFFLALALECGMQMSDRLYLRAARAHSEAKRAKTGGAPPEDEVQEPQTVNAQKVRESASNVEVPRKKGRDWVVEQTMNLTALIDEGDMTSKERDAVFVLLSYLRRQGQKA